MQSAHTYKSIRDWHKHIEKTGGLDEISLPIFLDWARSRIAWDNFYIIISPNPFKHGNQQEKLFVGGRPTYDIKIGDGRWATAQEQYSTHNPSAALMQVLVPIKLADELIPYEAKRVTKAKRVGKIIENALFGDTADQDEDKIRTEWYRFSLKPGSNEQEFLKKLEFLTNYTQDLLYPYFVSGFTTEVFFVSNLVEDLEGIRKMCNVSRSPAVESY